MICTQSQSLYIHGARKVAVFGLGLIGCTPAKVSDFGASASGCVDKINAAVTLFNERLKPIIDELNNKFGSAKYIYINTTNISLGDPSSIGKLHVSSYKDLLQLLILGQENYQELNCFSFLPIIFRIYSIFGTMLQTISRFWEGTM